MELELHRTKCGKFDDDIDNCPFQESLELNNIRHAGGTLRYIAKDTAWGGEGGGTDDTVIPWDTEE